MISNVQLNSVAPLPATDAPTAAPPAAAPAGPSSVTTLSPSAHMLSRLQELAVASPTQFQSIALQAAASLRSITAQGDPAQAGAVNQVADAFAQAGRSGDVSSLHAVAASAASSLPHHRHHATAVEASAEAVAGGPTPSGMTSSAQQVMDDVSVQVDQALGLDPPPLGPWIS